MTFQAYCWSVDGNPRNGNNERLMLDHAIDGNQGVLNPLDCIVQATSPNSQGVQILPGSVMVLGQEISFQGMYQGVNIGNDLSLASFTPTGASTRSDMVVAQVQDPTWQGSPWGNSAAGPIIVPAIISNVTPGSVLPPVGTSSLALARIDWPANTSIITQTMINDLRVVSNPNRIRACQQLQGFWTSSSSSPTSASIVQWPLGATWSVSVPSWATQMLAEWTLYQVSCSTGSAAAGVQFYPVIGASVSSPTVQFGAALANATTGMNTTRQSFGGMAQAAIPASIRGTTQTLQFAAFGSTAGTLVMDTSSALVIDYEFLGYASTS